MSSVLEVVHGMLPRKRISEKFKGPEAIFRQLPAFDDIKNIKLFQGEGEDTIEELFNKFCAKKGPVNFNYSYGVPAIDRLYKQEAQVRFMVQLIVHLDSAGRLGLLQSKLSAQLPKIGLDEWSEISALLGDSGVNVNIPGIVGVRRHPNDEKVNQFGALAGGLGDKISKQIFDAIQTELARPDLDAEVRKKLEQKLISTDNVFLDGRQYSYVPFAEADPEDVKKVEFQTVARESLEELTEVLIADFKLNPPAGKSFADVMCDALDCRQDAAAKSIFEEIGLAINRPDYSEIVYKNEIEAKLARFLKTTQTGRTFKSELAASLIDPVFVTDVSFPKVTIGNGGKIAAMQEGAEKDKKCKEYLPGENSGPILVPQSVCWGVDSEKLMGTKFEGLKNAAFAAAQRIGLVDGNSAAAALRKELGGDRVIKKDDGTNETKTGRKILFEFKGFSVKNAKFSVLVSHFIAESNSSTKSGRDHFMYVHECLASIKACVKSMNTQELGAAKQYMEYVAKDNPDFQEALKVVVNYKARGSRDEAPVRDEAEAFKVFFERPMQEREAELQRNSARGEKKVRFLEGDHRPASASLPSGGGAGVVAGFEGSVSGRPSSSTTRITKTSVPTSDGRVQPGTRTSSGPLDLTLNGRGFNRT